MKYIEIYKRAEKAVEMDKQGKNYKQIMEALGVSRMTVWRYIRSTNRKEVKHG